MTLKLVMLVVGSSVGLAAAPVLAQGRPLPLPKPPAPSQIGTAVPPVNPPNPRPSDERHSSAEYYRGRGVHRSLVRLPAQMGIDGRVYTNIGGALVPVTSQCSSRQTGVPQTPAPAYSQPEITQPVPQPILQPVPGAGQQPSSVVRAAPDACWTRAANGDVEVYEYR